MKRFLLLTICCWCSFANGLAAEDGWQDVLRRMPLDAATPLNRDNCLPLLLRGFQSNDVVKALVFLPAVSDDFYLINREKPKLDIRASNLLSAIIALTNATAVCATFRAPLLLLHLDRDRAEPGLMVNHQPTAERLKHGVHLPHPVWIDAHWDHVQPLLAESMKIDVLPEPQSVDAWHFARHNAAAWNLTDWDVLAVLSLTGKTGISIENRRVRFQNREATR